MVFTSEDWVKGLHRIIYILYNLRIIRDRYVSDPWSTVQNVAYN